MQNQTKVRRVIALLALCTLLAVTLVSATPAVSPSVRVIVQGTSVDDAAAAVRANGGLVTAEVSIISAVVAKVPQGCLSRLAETPGVVRVTLDRPVQASGGRSRVDVEFTKAVGVQEVWDTDNLGTGVTVAFLDTGIDPTFTDLRRPPNGRGNRILAYYDALSGRLYNSRRLLRSPRDPNGHGTHVAGIAGNSAYERQDGEYRGIAPAADLVAVRVLDETGVGTYADVIEGIQWVVDNKDTYNIRVLNISMYATVFAPYWADPFNLATMAAWQAGIVVVACAGNDGPAPLSVGVPGNTPYIITVGAFTDNYTPEDFGDDYIPPFSATGPTLDAFVKPDVIAPGAHVISLMRRNTYLNGQYPENRVNGRYFRMTGTSMSTAVVSGIAALMLSEDPDLTPDEVKYRMAITARPQFSEYSGEAAYSIWEQGAGRVWAPDAVFTDIEGEANEGMDLAADLAGEKPEDHYQGWAVYDPETEEFWFHGDDGDWAGGYNRWTGDYHDWAGGYSGWAGGTTNWSGDFNDWLSGYTGWTNGYNPWAGGYSGWAGGYSGWAGGYSGWAGGYSGWAGGYSGWAGGYSGWAGGYSGWAGGYSGWAGSTGDPDWAADFANLENVPSGAASVGINNWVGDD
ncbi:MAG: S8 family serine peptidase [Chloroflexota bacterium]|nr:S8 family serine peptidase [Chloroflexota bacterium]